MVLKRFENGKIGIPPILPKIPQKDYRIYLWVFLLAIGARILFFITIDEPILFFKYPFFAEKLARGESIGTRLVDLSPFYLYFLTFLKKIFDIDWHFLKYIQSFIGAVTCLLVLIVGMRAFRKEVGLLAALLYAAYGNMIILESTLEPTVFVLLFNLLFIFFLFLYRDSELSFRNLSKRAIVTGLFAGLSIITKPNALLFIPLGVVWFLFFSGNRVSFFKKVQLVLFFSSTTLLVILPITMRNYIMLGDFVLVTADAGKVFYHGNGKGATILDRAGLPDEGFAEEEKAEPDYAHVLFRETASQLSGKLLSPSESSTFWFRKTLEEIANDSKTYIIREIEKLFYFFNDYEMHYIASAYKEYKTSLSFPFIRYCIISSLGLLGMAFSMKRFRSLFPIYGIVFIYLISGMLFLVQSRYRTPAVPYLCMFSAVAIYKLREIVSTKKIQTIVVSLLAVCLLFVSSRFTYQKKIDAVDLWQTATKIHYQMKAFPLFINSQYSDAITELNKCLDIAPDFSPAYNMRGKSHAILGKYEAALEDFYKVIGLSPTIAVGYKNAGYIYLIQKKAVVAKRYLGKAFQLSPHDTKLKKIIEELN